METEIKCCKNCGDTLPPYAGVGPRREYCVKATCNAQNRGKTTNFTLTRLKYGWSKHGGGRHLLKKAMPRETWFCQACGEEQPKELSAYMFPMFHEFIRICSRCQNQVMENTIVDFNYLKRFVKHLRD